MNNGITKKQQQIITLKNEGYTFHQISKSVGMTPEIAHINYNYAIHKLNGDIPNKNTELNEKQKNNIIEALEVLTNHLRELKKLEKKELDKLSYDPKDLINICQEMSDKVEGNFDKNEFTSLT